MSQSLFIALLLALALIAANLPFISQRLMWALPVPGGHKNLAWRVLELLLGYAIVGAIGDLDSYLLPLIWGQPCVVLNRPPEPCLSLAQITCSFSQQPTLPKIKDLRVLCCRLVTQSCLTLCNPMNCSTPGFPIHHQHPELAQTQVH